MTLRWGLLTCTAIAMFAGQTAASAQSLEVKRYNPSEWTKGRFTEIVTVTGPGKTIYLAGVGAEDEKAPAGQSAPVLHLGDPYEQCRLPTTKSNAAWLHRARHWPMSSSRSSM
jgi:hypothetical protein